ncbi:hypothetical protein Tco_1074912 [Tanacetum coccineum]
MILISPDEKMYSYAIHLNFNAPDDNMDYEALLAGLVSSTAKVPDHASPQDLELQSRSANLTCNHKVGIPQPRSIDGSQDETISRN